MTTPPPLSPSLLHVPHATCYWLHATNYLPPTTGYMPHAKGVEETKYLLLLGKDLGYIQDAAHTKLAEEYALVGKMLNGPINSLERRPDNEHAQNTKH